MLSALIQGEARRVVRASLLRLLRAIPRALLVLVIAAALLLAATLDILALMGR